MDESIAARSAKLSSLALIPEVITSHREDAYGCSGDPVSESRRIHQAVKTWLFMSRRIENGVSNSQYRRLVPSQPQSKKPVF
ncbi:hypothetical protein [Calothrix sp. PCC 7507]|uniref:hypothetical protein n=1 Tax=Calothrix sp. PCC 7507 TaxID=99598 RepID=UPI0009FDA341|nr:hypothetical protein [Calothrix sp. PCC 7507]